MDPQPPLPHLPFFPFSTATLTTAPSVPAAAPSAVQTQFTPSAPPPPPPPAAAPEAAHNHVAHVANPTSAAAPQSFNHPPYADMIYAAITALKEKEGSSKRAIAKYIERVYTGLPPTHSALLTHHLKRLKNNGLLVLVKKSYKIPRSDDSADYSVANTATTNNFNNFNDNNNTVANAGVASADPNLSGPKRGRGRPPKPKSDGVSQPNAAAPVMVPVGISVSTTQPIVDAAMAGTTPQSDGAKRGPGRPKKGAGVGVAGLPGAVVKRRGRPPKSGPLGPIKSPGRPRKLKSVASNAVRKGPKRLPKSVVVPYATAAGVGGGGGGSGAVAGSPVVPRPRGRPKKGAEGGGGGVGVVVGGAVVVQGKRPGRPPKVFAAGGGIVKPNKRPGRPVGRPKKNTNISWAATEASQLEAYKDLKTKFEFFQSKVRQAVGVLRPQVTNETPITVIAAIQELEGLASMDVNPPPPRDEAQPPALPPLAQSQPAIIQN